MKDDLDLVLRWTLVDLFPEEDPPAHVWHRIQARLSQVKPSKGKLSATLMGKISMRIEKVVWQPFPPTAPQPWSFAEEVSLPHWPHWRALPRLAL